uniref:hypothetical protein n=1 Tax=Acinetobacter soli TaxID=487316 RepID=UPI00125D4E3B
VLLCGAVFIHFGWIMTVELLPFVLLAPVLSAPVLLLHTLLHDGQAMQSLTQLVDKMPEVGLAWSGIAYQERESSNQAVWLYVIS